MVEIIIHCFRWKLKDIIANLNKIKECGYTAIQITPIQECKQGEEWWCYYQPLSFNIGNKSGNKEELKELCSKANKLDIKIIVDVVLRHTATDDGQLIPSLTVDAKLRDNKDFWTNSANIIDYDNRDQTIKGSLGLPMLNYDNLDLQYIYIDFLQELKDCGVNGFRVDMAKHFAIPTEGSDFWVNVFGRFSSMFNYGECINSSRELLDKYTPYIKTLSETDTTNKSDSVVFFMSHDTELNKGVGTRHMTDEDIKREWEILREDYKESSVLFFPRENSDLWKNESIKQSNLLHNC